MTSPSSLPIPSSNGSIPSKSTGADKKSESSRTAEAKYSASSTSFHKQFNDTIIDIYERSEVNTAVPDERTVADRRQSATRRQSAEASSSVASANRIDQSLPEQKINATSIKTESSSSVIFSPPQEKGKLVDTWA